jgi:hypothetical protein
VFVVHLSDLPHAQRPVHQVIKAFGRRPGRNAESGHPHSGKAYDNKQVTLVFKISVPAWKIACRPVASGAWPKAQFCSIGLQ